MSFAIALLGWASATCGLVAVWAGAWEFAAALGLIAIICAIAGPSA